MNYKLIYNNLINKAKNRLIKQDVYYEKHHILPKSLNGSDLPENIVKLTLREHYFAHKLLCFINPDSKKLAQALWLMTTTTKRAYNNFINNTYTRSDGEEYKRVLHYLDKTNKKIYISSRDYDFARTIYVKHMNGRVITNMQKQNISKGTILGMRNAETIKKCASGSKNCHYYRNKITGEVHKWFPGDKDIDLSIYEYGRGHLSDEQKKKISKTQHLNKCFYIIPKLNIKYMCYCDYIKAVPKDWKKGWNNFKNKRYKDILITAIKYTNLSSNYKYEHILTINTNEYANLKIISPSIYEVCIDILLDIKDNEFTDKHNIDKLSNKILSNIELINILNKKYINNYNESIKSNRT